MNLKLTKILKKDKGNCRVSEQVRKTYDPDLVYDPPEHSNCRCVTGPMVCPVAPSAPFPMNLWIRYARLTKLGATEKP